VRAIEMRRPTFQDRLDALRRRNVRRRQEYSTAGFKHAVDFPHYENRISGYMLQNFEHHHEVVARLGNRIALPLDIDIESCKSLGGTYSGAPVHAQDLFFQLGLEDCDIAHLEAQNIKCEVAKYPRRTDFQGPVAREIMFFHREECLGIPLPMHLDIP